MKSKIYIGVTIFLAILTHWLWFFTTSLLTYGDWYVHLNESLRELVSLPWSWAMHSFGSPNMSVSFYPFNLISGLLASLNFSYGFIERIVFMWAIALVTAVGSYLLVRKIIGSNVGAMIGSLVFSYNTYFLLGQTGHLTLMAAFAFAPLILLSFMKSLETKSIFYILLTALLCFISSFYESRAFYIIFFVLLFYFVYYFFVIETPSRNQYKKHILLLFLFIGVTGLLNAYWLIGLYKLNLLANNDLFSRGLFGNQYMNIRQAFTLFHPWWTYGKPAVFEVQPIPLIFFIIPLSAFTGLIVNRQNKNIVFFGLLAIVGILLTKQTDDPFPHLYLWLYNNLPGFSAFREASKFYSVIALSYSVLIGAFISWLWNINFKSRVHSLLAYSIITGIALLFLANTKPLITGDIGTLFTPRAIPNDYIVWKDFMLKQADYFRTLWSPRESRWGIYTNNHPKVSNVDLLHETWKDFAIVQEYPSNWPFKEQIIEILRHSFANSFLDSSSIRYVIVPIADVSNDDDIFVHYGKDRNFYINELNKLAYLKKLDLGLQELVIYENEGYKPHIYSLENLFNFTSLQKLEAKHDFITQHLKKDFYFVQTDNDVPVQLMDPFETIKREDIEGNKLKASPAYNGKISLYINSLKNTPPVEGSLKVYSKDNVLKFQESSNQNIGGLDYTKYELNLSEDDIFQYINGITYANIIPNHSLENGLWTEHVGDCNHYDENGLMDMKHAKTEQTDGQYSLQLEATRHIACTNTGKINVKEKTNYLFSFDYKSLNAKHAGYYISFDDPLNTVISEKVPIPDGKWQNFNKTINAPTGATTMSLTVYAYATDGQTNNIVHYDNFSFIELPYLNNRYYVVGEPGSKIQSPQGVDFEIVNPTKKIVHITSTSTSFYLAMSEAYHPQWRLMINNKRVNGTLKGWIPWIKPDQIPSENHLKLNDFLNGWFVDVDDLCKNRNLCTLNADGTYNMEMVIEFYPQRWFYIGGIISLTTLTGSIGYLFYIWRKRQRKVMPEVDTIYKPPTRLFNSRYVTDGTWKLRLKMYWYRITDWLDKIKSRRYRV